MELMGEYPTTLVIDTLEIKKSTFYRHLNKRKTSVDASNERKERNRGREEKELNQELLREIRTILKEHPFWGYRRVWAYLKHVKGYQINRKRIYRLMKQEGLLQKKNTALRAKRTPKKKPKAEKPREILGIDGTKFWINGLGWTNLIIVIDWYTKEILGHEISLRNKGIQWITALQEALFNGYPEGAKDKGIKLVSDHGSQPTSKSFMKFCSELGIKQIFASYNNPKGNAETERMIRTIKEEVIWVHEFESLEEAKGRIKEFIEFYNREYPHSAIGYKSPSMCFREWMEGEGGKKVA